MRKPSFLGRISLKSPELKGWHRLSTTRRHAWRNTCGDSVAQWLRLHTWLWLKNHVWYHSSHHKSSQYCKDSSNENTTDNSDYIKLYQTWGSMAALCFSHPLMSSPSHCNVATSIALAGPRKRRQPSNNSWHSEIVCYDSLESSKIPLGPSP